MVSGSESLSEEYTTAGWRISTNGSSSFSLLSLLSLLSMFSLLSESSLPQKEEEVEGEGETEGEGAEEGIGVEWIDDNVEEDNEFGFGVDRRSLSESTMLPRSRST